MRSLLEDRLYALMEERQVMLDAEEKYYEQFTEEELGSDDLKEYEQDPKCEELRLHIMDFVYDNYVRLSVEAILEGLTSTGAAPSLLYDDNGHFAFGGEGMQNIMIHDGVNPDEDMNFEGMWLFKEKDWKPTVRGAINAYFEKDQFEKDKQ